MVLMWDRQGKTQANSALQSQLPPFSPSGPKAASRPSRQKQIPSGQSLPQKIEGTSRNIPSDRSERTVYRILLGVLGCALFSHFGRVLQLGANFFRVHCSHGSFIHTQCDKTLPVVVLTFRPR